MPKIVQEQAFNGAVAKIERLGLLPLMAELRSILTGFALAVLERTDANGGAAVRRMIDDRFAGAGGWTKKQTGDVDWTKCHVGHAKAEDLALVVIALEHDAAGPPLAKQKKQH